MNEFAKGQIIDHDKMSILKKLSGGDKLFIDKLLSIFFERAPLLIMEMEKSLREDNARSLENAAHALKGSTGSIGAVALMKICSEIELKARSKDLSGAEELLRNLSDLYPHSKMEIENFFK